MSAPLAEPAPRPGSVPLEECPKRHLHTACPRDYLGWHEWAEKKGGRHYQVRCPGCNLLAIWKRKRASVPAVLPKEEA